MIVDNEFLFNRDSEYQNSKYIFLARLEKAGQDEGSLEDKIKTIKS